MKQVTIAVITGASSGIGWEFARQLDRRLYTVDQFWLIARRKEKLEELAGKLEHPCRILPLDLEDGTARETLGQLLAQEAPIVRMLVNCAGYGIMGNTAEMTVEEQVGMVNLNSAALLDVTCRCLPYMRKKSRILQLASSAAFLPQPGFAVYAAAKSFVLSFSRALGEELRDREILVTAVCPGPVRTPFFARAEKYGGSLSLKKVAYVEPKRVVAEALEASRRGKAISVCSPWMKAFWILTKVAPHQGLLLGLRFLRKAEKEKNRAAYANKTGGCVV